MIMNDDHMMAFWLIAVRLDEQLTLNRFKPDY
jgi:hypothetical protein